MALIYGEGRAKAFRRLQEEILKSSYDHVFLRPGMEIRSIIWLSTLEDEVRQYRCAILCGIVGYGPLSDTVRCWPITAEKIFPYPRLRGQTLDSSNPNLMDLLSRQSIVRMLGRITGPPLGAGGYVPQGMSDLKTGLEIIKTGLEESTFLETSYLTLNIEITSTRP
ncbi:HET-domain-containing protein [Apiospora saccharicola]